MTVRAHPHPEIRNLAEANGEQLHHFRADLYWTISTVGTSEQDPYRYATYHSPTGAAVMEISKATDEDCRLTNRQLQIATLGAIGLSGKEIGKQLYISIDTVKTTRARIQDLLGIARKNGPAVEPTIPVCFAGSELGVVRPLPHMPARLCAPVAQRILRAAGQGATIAETALELGFDTSVIKMYRHSIFGGNQIVRSAAEAITLMHLSPGKSRDL